MWGRDQVNWAGATLIGLKQKASFLFYRVTLSFVWNEGFATKEVF